VSPIHFFRQKCHEKARGLRAELLLFLENPDIHTISKSEYIGTLGQKSRFPMLFNGFSNKILNLLDAAKLYNIKALSERLLAHWRKNLLSRKANCKQHTLG